MYLQLALIVTAIKAALIPAYRSTDFEVHRNWLAITHSLPFSKWYEESTSEWTLDYPPLFAWFEWALSQVAKLVDPEMLVVSNLDYASLQTVVFQRATVIVCDVVLILAAYQIARCHPGKRFGPLTFLLIVGNAGLLIVDHIHFQYNGVMLGLLLWSIHCMQQQQDLAGGVLFAVLLNMKHLFAYSGPVYFVYILRHYCIGRNAIGKFLLMAVAVAAVFAVSFGPFFAIDQMGQVLSRLFPFGRGLTHAYWAGNTWALYSFADKALAQLLPRMGVPVDVVQGNLAGGLVGVSHFSVLPQVEPRHTLLAVLLALLPCVVSLARRPLPQRFAAAVAYSTLSGFVFGYHVHEKAILPALIPLAVWAASPNAQGRHRGDFLVLSAAGLYGLLPLLYQPQEYLIKLGLAALYWYAAWQALRQQDSSAGGEGGSGRKRQLLSRVEWLYLGGFVPLELYCTFLHPAFLAQGLPFLPLMMTSVYSALGVLWVWGRMAVSYAFGNFKHGGY